MRSTDWIGWARRPWIPLDFGGVLLWVDVSRKAALGLTPRPGGAAPPALTWSGPGLTIPQELYVAIDSVAGGTARGQATFKWGIAGSAGATLATGVLTAVTTDLATPQGTVTLAWPAGTYATDQSWSATVETPGDNSGLGNDPTMATAANQCLYRATAFNGLPSLDWGTGASGRGYATPSFTLPASHSILATVQANASSGYLCTHNDDGAGGRYIYGTNNSASYVNRSALQSGKNVSATWLSDGVARTVAVTYGGSHATHLIYRNGVLDTMTDSGAFTESPNAAQAGIFRLGRNGSGILGFRGLMRDIVVVNRVVTPTEVGIFHAYSKANSKL